jgi:hypothetical protein
MTFTIQKQKIIQLSTFMSLIGAFSIISIHIIRTIGFTSAPIMTLIIGIAPNFFGSFILTYLLLGFLVRKKVERLYTKFILRRLLVFSFSSFLLLLLWELLQNFLWYYTIDSSDLVASFIASWVCYFIGWIYIRTNREAEQTAL